MVFVVKYRGRDGAMSEAEIEAADRAGCVAECRRRGISPMGILERKRGKSAASPKGSPGQRRLTGKAAILAAVALIAVVGGVWLWVATAREDASPPKMEKPAKPKVEKPKAEKPEAKEAVTNAPAVAAATGSVEKVVQTPMGEKRVKVRYSKAVQAALASADTPPIVDLRPPPPDPNAPPPPPPRYKNSLHQQLSEYAWSGRFVGVPDPISNKEARKLVEEPVEFLPDDTPEVRQEKETVAAMQNELKEYMENGGRANDYFMKLMQRQDAENETIREARRQIRELCKVGDFELAEQTRTKFNEYLKGKGLPPLAMANYMKLAKKQSDGGKSQGSAPAQKK